jgi:hypothetical protein
MLMCARLHPRLEDRFHVSGCVLLARDSPKWANYRNAITTRRMPACLGDREEPNFSK